ncbi:MAG TPA: phosphoglycerate kinase [Proteobacteria bacterium]|nr:bifunctional PGK/TIM [bacterium BMS3Abin14]HDL54200.1 phosphoglycerate kinase [Pseudomonadota bacterium]
MRDKLTVEDVDFRGKRALVRVDYNVPLDSDGNITDDSRIRATLPTINHILDRGGSAILMSHLGRPKGKMEPEMSLSPVARRLGRLLHQYVMMAPDCIGDEVKKLVSDLHPGDILLLENLRFHPGESADDPEFSKELASLGEIYVDDAFATAHRSHASVVGVPAILKPAVAGFLVKSEISFFRKALEDPVRPLAAIIGGAKVSGKIEAVVNLLDKADKILIGGGMAFTFLKSLGMRVGRSIIDEEMLDLAREITEGARERGIPFYLPVDTVAAREVKERAEARIFPCQEIPDDYLGLDIGPATVTLFQQALSDARTIVWNGPMGVFELSPFSKGTFAIVETLARSQALTILGGGDTDVAVHATGNSDRIDYISTGGGAFLKLLETGELPGVNALDGR